MKLILLTILVVGISLILLSVRIIVKKNGKFSSQHISQNEAMRREGISCATSQDRQQRAHESKKMDIKEL